MQLIDGPRVLDVLIENGDSPSPRTLDLWITMNLPASETQIGDDETFCWFELQPAQAREVAAELLRLAAEIEAPDGPPDQVQ